jgi:UDP-glucose 4-epimerase
VRILVTGLGTFWGSRLAQYLETQPSVEVLVGVDTRDPRVPLDRTEFVRVDASFDVLARIVKAADIDTILHTHLIVDSTQVRGRHIHETNVIETMNLLAAAGAAGSPVRKFVLKSSTLLYGSNYQDPYFFREGMSRTQAPRTRVERSLVEVASIVRDFAEDNPDIVVTKLEFANVLGRDIDSAFSRILRRPVVPEILGFDPRLQFVHEDDVTGALAYATLRDVPGEFNVAGDGPIPWSEVCSIAGKRRVALPPVGTALAAAPLHYARLADMPAELLSLLRYGRAVDTSRYRRAGFRYHYTTAGTVEAFAEGLRLERSVRSAHVPYRYERDIEAFFHHSPAVLREGNGNANGNEPSAAPLSGPPTGGC